MQREHTNNNQIDVICDSPLTIQPSAVYNHCLHVVSVSVCAFVSLCAGLQAKVTVMAAKSSGELLQAAALLGSVSCAVGEGGLCHGQGFDGREDVWLERREGKDR